MSKCYSYVRFSSAKQLQGDSLHRQMELSKNYAQKKGLVLDKTLTIKDLGLSAYNGEHIRKGAFGQFLELVKQGKIPKGSKLLVESLDRLSRANILDALTQLFDLIKMGITVVTLIDEVEYSSESISDGFNQLLISITMMSRAHEESKTKGLRVAKAWEEKRALAHKKKLTAKCPNWLTLNSDREIFSIISNRAIIVKRIFDMYLNGMGAMAICKYLNQENIEPWGRSQTGWHKSYISKILRNRSVIGEFQPRKKNSKGKYVPAGVPIKDYYPSVVGDEIFYRAQQLIEQNKTMFGRTGNISNLFSHKAKCGVCGASMTYVNKGNRSRKTLVCDAARRGRNCNYHSIPYDEFEKGFLQLCSSLQLADIVSGSPDENQLEVNKLLSTITAVEAKISHLSTRINNWTDILGDSLELREELTPRIDSSRKEKKILLQEKNSLLCQKHKLENQHQDASLRLNSIQQAIEAMNLLEGDELIALRKKLRCKIRELIKYIRIYSQGVGQRDKSHRSFRVRFQDGGLLGAKYTGSLYDKVFEITSEDFERWAQKATLDACQEVERYECETQMDL